MVTYNHEPYIAQAVESALAQQTTFPVEIVIGEDHSTDRTREIVRDLQRDHRKKIRLLLHPKNLGGAANVAATYDECRGKYVALLEGDDYWTNPHKLQRQVEALDAHPHWSACFHQSRRVFTDSLRKPELFPEEWTKNEATIDDLFRVNFIGTCSLVFRNRIFGPLPEWHARITPGDWAISLLCADRGPIGFLPEVMADYRIHSQGLWTQKSQEFRIRETLRMLSFVDHHFLGKYREQVEDHRQNVVSYLFSQIDEYSLRLTSPASMLPAIKVTPPQRRRSAASQLIRKVMRPMEEAVRKWRAA
jgi:glycosyltransferase involved in cell wall biosynthesis